MDNTTGKIETTYTVAAELGLESVEFPVAPGGDEIVGYIVAEGIGDWDSTIWIVCDEDEIWRGSDHLVH